VRRCRDARPHCPTRPTRLALRLSASSRAAVGPPYRKPVLVACGEPIPCPKTEEPSKELINEYHAKLMAGYQAVFEQHKAAYGWENRSLKLVD
jgi:hypothetical protein